MKFDPHIHSVYISRCTFIIQKIILKQAKKNRFGCNSHPATMTGLRGSRVTRSIAEDIIVVPSIEISAANGHILGLGVDEIIPKGLSGAETVDMIHDAGGLAIASSLFIL